MQYMSSSVRLFIECPAVFEVDNISDNNYCGLQHYKNPNDWNFDAWDNWARKISPNRDVKVYIGAPASSAAGSGYVNSNKLTSIIQQTQSNYSSFGGVMLWDASDAYANHRYDKAVKQALTHDED